MSLLSDDSLLEIMDVVRDASAFNRELSPLDKDARSQVFRAMQATLPSFILSEDNVTDIVEHLSDGDVLSLLEDLNTLGLEDKRNLLLNNIKVDDVCRASVTGDDWALMIQSDPKIIDDFADVILSLPILEDIMDLLPLHEHAHFIREMKSALLSKTEAIHQRSERLIDTEGVDEARGADLVSMGARIRALTTMEHILSIKKDLNKVSGIISGYTLLLKGPGSMDEDFATMPRLKDLARAALRDLAEKMIKHRVTSDDKPLMACVSQFSIEISNAKTGEDFHELDKKMQQILTAISSPEVVAVLGEIAAYRTRFSSKSGFFNRYDTKADRIEKALAKMSPMERATVISAETNAVQEELQRGAFIGKATSRFSELKAQFSQGMPNTGRDASVPLLFRR